MKDGARREEQNKIKALEKEGYTAEEISNMMQISQRCVKSFMEEDFGSGEDRDYPEVEESEEE